MSQNPYAAIPRGPLPEREPLEGRRPRILASVPWYVPGHNAGGEATMHALLQHLVREGWDAKVAVTAHRGEGYTWDGVEVIPSGRDRELGALWVWADVGITHLHGTRSALGWKRRGRPLVHLVHNHMQMARERVPVGGADLVIWNSQWIANEWKGRDVWPSTVVHPIVEPDRYRTDNPHRNRDGAVTLINLCEIKGGLTFWRLCAERPDLRFLGVLGAYHQQEVPSRMPRNAAVMENQADVRSVYRETRVLLIPSGYESWGRVALEAMASGIPVIASRTPGLVESCTSPVEGECALLCDADDPEQWDTALATLDDPRAWEEWSRRSLVRSAEVAETTTEQVKDLTERLYLLAGG